MPQVSVVIPVYNIEAHLRQCLDSVAGQTLSDLEVVCVDDGSTDASPAILEEYAQKDPRFQVIRQANAGPGAARNRGMERSSGRYLIFLDSDDWFEPDFLERMTARAEETGADVTICRADEFDTHSGQVYDGSWMLKTQLLPGAVFSPREAAGAVFQFTYGWPWDKLYRRDYILKEKFQYPDLAVSQDLVFVYPSVFCAGRIAVLDRVLIHHRVNRLSSVSNSRHLHPDVPCRAMQLLHQELQQRGLFDAYEQSFLSWAMDFLVWNAANMGNKSAQRQYLHDLKTRWFPRLHFEVHPGSYYGSKTVYLKYLLAKYLPWFVFSGIVSCYKSIKKRVRNR